MEAQVAMANNNRPAASASEYQIVSRKRMELRLIARIGTFRKTKAIADTTHGMDQLGLRRRIDFLAKQSDEGFEGIFFNVRIKAPNRLKNGAAGDGAAGMTKQ